MGLEWFRYMFMKNLQSETDGWASTVNDLFEASNWGPRAALHTARALVNGGQILGFSGQHLQASMIWWLSQPRTENSMSHLGNDYEKNLFIFGN